MREGAQLSQARRFGEAIAKLRSVLASNPGLSDAWSLLAKCYEEAEDYENAVAAYRKTIELSPTTSGETALSLASVFLKMNRLEDAESHAELGLRTNPASARILLGRVALARKNMQKAGQALVVASPGAESYRVAAETFEELGARDEAARWRRRGAR